MSGGQSYLAIHKASLSNQNFWQDLKTSMPTDLTTEGPWETAEEAFLRQSSSSSLCMCRCMCAPVCQCGHDNIVKGISAVMSVTFSEPVCWRGCGPGLFSPPLTSRLHSDTSWPGNPLQWRWQDAHCCCWMKSVRIYTRSSFVWVLGVFFCVFGVSLW